MYLLVKCAGVFDNSDGMSGFVTEDGRWVFDWSVFTTCYITPKVDDIGYNCGVSKGFWEGKYKKAKNKHALIRCEFRFEKSGGWVDKVGSIVDAFVEVDDIVNELLR